MSLRYKFFFINFFGLTLLLFGSLYLDNFRNRLIDVSVQSLRVQAQTIANVIAASAVDDENIFAENIDIRDNIHSYTKIYPVFARAVIAELLDKENYRAIIYDRFGTLIHDSEGKNIPIKREIIAQQGNFEPIRVITAILAEFAEFVTSTFADNKIIKDPKILADVRQKALQAAFSGKPVYFTGLNEDKKLIINFIQPVQRYHAVLGVLSLTARGSDINKLIEEQQVRVIVIFLITSFFVITLSFMLAYTIINPIQKLGEAAKKISLQKTVNFVNIKDIPDFSKRKDEIASLSIALRKMTNNIVRRIEDIEKFAADVAHELKNPITSLASAIEILPRAKKQTDKDKLLDIMAHDVKRIDRLITDISEASRIDAELNRQDNEVINIKNMLETYVDFYNNKKNNSITVKIQNNTKNKEPNWNINGNELRLGQVINNILDNAISYNLQNQPIEISINEIDNHKTIEIIIADSGKGIHKNDLEKVFERFYTDRNEKSDNHSGLGLSISRQIVEAHEGEIWAQTRPCSKISHNDKQNGTAIIIHLPSYQG